MKFICVNVADSRAIVFRNAVSIEQCLALVHYWLRSGQLVRHEAEWTTRPALPDPDQFLRLVTPTPMRSASSMSVGSWLIRLDGRVSPLADMKNALDFDLAPLIEAAALREAPRGTVVVDWEAATTFNLTVTEAVSLDDPVSDKPGKLEIIPDEARQAYELAGIACGLAQEYRRYSAKQGGPPGVIYAGTKQLLLLRYYEAESLLGQPPFTLNGMRVVEVREEDYLAMGPAPLGVSENGKS